MTRWIKFPITVAVIAFLAMPAAFIATLLLYPLWSWIEATFGIESVGHSGPADWCFLVVYGTLLAAALLLLWRSWRGRAADSKLP